MGKENNINDKENQEEIQSNNNENDEQSEEVSEEFKNEIQGIIYSYDDYDVITHKICETTEKYLNLAKIGDTISDIVEDYIFHKSDIIDGFTQGFISQEDDLTKISDTFSKIVQNNQYSASYIVSGFTRGCISKDKNLEYICNVISTIIKKDEIKNGIKIDLVSDIIDGFTRGCISEKNDLTDNDIINAISTIINTNGIKENPDLVSDIVCGFTNGFNSEKKDLTDNDIINVISTIINTNGIKENSYLVSDIVCGFAQNYISPGSDLTNIGDKIFEIAHNNNNYVSDIVCGFARGCISKLHHLYGISNTISNIVKDNQESALNIVDHFTQVCFSAGDNLDNKTYIGGTISDIVKDNQESILNIVCGFTKGCISQRMNLSNKDIQDTFYSIAQHNKDYVSDIVCGFTKGCISEGKNLTDTDISNVISTIIKAYGIKENPILVFNVINSFTKDLVSQENDISQENYLKNISYAISTIIKTKEIKNGTKDNPYLVSNIIDGFTQGCISAGKDLKYIGNVISTIINTNGIKENPDLVSNIIDGFTHGCISQGKNLKDEDIGNAISTIINTNVIKEIPNLAANIIYDVTQGFISKEEKNLTKICNIISNIVKDNQKSALDIIDGFTQGCIDKGQQTEDIGKLISTIIQTDGIKNNTDLVSDIVYSFTQVCISKKNDSTKNDSTKISDIIYNIVKDNQDSALNIICSFTQGCINKGQNIKNIGEAVTDIIQTDGIKDNPDLVFNIINGFVKGCLMKKPDNIEDIAKSFSSSLNKMEEETKDALKPIFSLIVSQYFMNTLTNSSNGQSSENNKKTEEQLSEDNKKETETEEQLVNTLTNSSNEQLSKGNNKKETEKQLFDCYKELFHEEDNETIKSFKDIPLEKLSGLQDEYLKEIFKKEGLNGGGTAYETFLKMACNLMPKSKENKEPTVGKLEEQKDIFKDLKFIRLNNNDNIKSKEKLFGEIGLTEKNFGTNRGSEDSDFSIVHCSYLGHAFVMVIDKTKEWEDAINKDIESICLIDSSQYIQSTKTFSRSSLEDKQDIFEKTPTLNNCFYQENGTCWLNTMSAVGFLLEKQQERMSKQNKEQQEQIEQTEQQEQQPRESYGLSIDKLLEGFGKKRNIINGKIENITESTTSQEEQSSFEQDICDITESTTPPEKLSSFEQGICDYSTEHFYTLTDISDKERNIIKKFLAKKVKENKINESKILQMFNRLFKRNNLDALKAKSEKTFIIKYDYLKESLERFKQDAEKSKELRAKLEPKQKEDSSNKKRKYNIFSSCIPGNKGGQNPQDIRKQNETYYTHK